MNAYLIHGAPGLGKRTYAAELAKSLLNTENLSACPDYTLVAASDAKPVREAMARAYIRPTVAGTRVIILTGAENMSPAAANSLLKTLEEPPETSVIIITATSKNALPKTVASRCRCVELFPKSPEEVETFLQERGRTLSKKDLAFCGGNLGKIIRLLDDEAYRAYLSDARALVTAVAAQNQKQTLRVLAPYDRKKDDLLEMLPLFAELCRQSGAPAQKNCVAALRQEAPSAQTAILPNGSGVSPRLFLAAEKANTAITRLQSNSNLNLVLNILSIELSS